MGRPPNDDYERELQARCEQFLGVSNLFMITNSKKLEKLIMLKAIYDQNISKLDEKDQEVFKGIIKDIFRSERVEANTSPQVKEDILFTIKLLGLSPERKFVESVISLNEVISNRHGIILVGPTMAGKSKALKVIEDMCNIT
jgi:dynein heavy chain, axonemal